MEELQENKYVKRTQNDYSMSFKLQVVPELEQKIDLSGAELLKYLFLFPAISNTII